MNVRLPKNGMNNIQQIAQRAQQAQAEMEKITDELEKKQYTATAGGEAAKVTVNGKLEVINIDLKPEIVDPEDTEMLADLIKGAINEAIKVANTEKDEAMQKISGQINIPGLF